MTQKSQSQDMLQGKGKFERGLGKFLGKDDDGRELKLKYLGHLGSLELYLSD